MIWRIKALIQRLISFLPSGLSYKAYYLLQRKLGGLRSISPINKFRGGVQTWKNIAAMNIDPSEKVFFEVGTGWVPNIPIAYWLMGAKKTITVDINPYVKDELVRESVAYIVDNKEEIITLFSDLLIKSRLEELIDLYNNTSNLTASSIFDLCCIEYISPGDAAETQLGDNCIDFHTSCTVLEHIPQNVLKNILTEGNRITKAEGLFVHRIDYSDHFSHTDKSISSINFLQYSDQEWEGYAGNRYMYMNRLRHDDFLDLFASVGHSVLLEKSDIDKNVLKLLESNKFVVDTKFIGKPNKVLSTIGSWFITQTS